MRAYSNRLLAIFVVIDFCLRLALPLVAWPISPSRPSEREICEFSKRPVSLKRASKTNDDSVLQIGRCATEYLPIAIRVMANATNGMT